MISLNPFAVSRSAAGKTWRQVALSAVLTGLAWGSVQAQDLEAMTRDWVEQAMSTMEGMNPNAPLRIEVEVGQLNDRLRLAPCAKVEPYLPNGTKLWGRTRLGLRCVDGATRWSVFLPLNVKAYGPAWVLTQDVPTGTVLGPEHVMEAEANWAEQAGTVIADAAQWQGQTASRPLKAGQALRQNMVRAPQAFRAGAQVRVLATGSGYTVSAVGKAMAAASIGQSVRVRMDSGKIVTGTVAEDGAVLVPL